MYAVSHFNKQWKSYLCRSWWPCGLRRLSGATCCWDRGSNPASGSPDSDSAGMIRLKRHYRTLCFCWTTFPPTNDSLGYVHPRLLLGSGSKAACLLGSWVRIPPRAWMSICCECLLSGRGLCVEPISRREMSYRVWCVWVWSWSLDNEEALAHWGMLFHGKQILKFCCLWQCYY
jgi:hypothetical protein